QCANARDAQVARASRLPRLRDGHPFAAPRAGSARALLALVSSPARPYLPGVELDFPAAGTGRSRDSGRDARAKNYLNLRSRRGVSHHTSWPGFLGGNSSKLIMQQPPFLNPRLAWLPAPISRAVSSLRSGSWPTTRTLVRLGRLARKAITSSGDPPGRIESQTSTGALEASESAMIAAVSTARTSGLVTIQSTSNPIRLRPSAISRIF